MRSVHSGTTHTCKGLGGGERGKVHFSRVPIGSHDADQQNYFDMLGHCLPDSEFISNNSRSGFIVYRMLFVEQLVHLYTESCVVV